MHGLAQQLFFEREGRSLDRQQNAAWPLLQRLVSEKRLASIDISLAEMLLKPYPDAGQEVASFLCYLSLATRQGHLCIQVANKLSPEPAALLQNECEDFATLVRKGAHLLPAPLLEGPLRRNGQRFYFERYWSAEQQCLQLFNTCLHSKPALQVNLEHGVKGLLESGKLLPEQGETIVKAMQNSVTLLCGGPGTGKTYTIGHLVRLFLESLPPEKRSSSVVALAAPTGKAAMHLQKSLHTNLKADTLHALLGVGSRKAPDLSADLIIVDESSMIDITLMNALLAAIKPGARLILSGDRHQLAPVGSGSLFADLVQYVPSHTVELKTCLRTERASIAQFASAVQAGKTEELLYTQEDLICHPLIDSLNLEDVVARFDPQHHSPEQLLQRFSAFRLLSPLRKGPHGVNELNRQCHALATKRRHSMAPIIITKTDRRLGLFNGEVGLIAQDQAYFSGSEGVRRISTLLLPPFEYAYCLSVYKSQGSEFDEVWIVLPEGSQYFGREVLYTAVTRARRQIQLWSTPEVLVQTVERQAVRLSGICGP